MAECATANHLRMVADDKDEDAEKRAVYKYLYEAHVVTCALCEDVTMIERSVRDEKAKEARND